MYYLENLYCNWRREKIIEKLLNVKDLRLGGILTTLVVKSAMFHHLIRYNF